MWLAAAWTGAALFVLLAAAGVWLFTADLGVLKPQIERLVSSRTGRDLTIAGELSIELGALTTLHAENIRFENTDWAGESNMIEVRTLDVRVDLWSIFADVLIVEHIGVEDARIHLELSDSGEANWRLGGPSERESKQSGGFEFLLEQLAVSRVELRYDSPLRTAPLVVRLESLVQAHRSDDFLELSLEGAVADRIVDLTGRIGTWDALLAGKNVVYELSASLDTATLVSNGRIDDLLRPHRPSLEFSLVGPDINDLTRMFGLGDDGQGNIGLSGALVARGDEPLVLTVEGNVGETEIDARGSFSDLSRLDEMDLVLSSNGPSLAETLVWFGVDAVPETPFVLDVKARRRGPKLVIESAALDLGDAGFDVQADLPSFPRLDGARIKADVAGPAIETFRALLGLPGVASGPFALRAEFDGSVGGEESLRLSIDTSLGRLEANGALGPAPEFLGSRMRIRLEANSLAAIGEGLGVPDLPDRPISGNAVLEWAGDRLITREPLVTEIGDVVAQVEGDLAIAPGLIGSDVAFELRGPDLAALVAPFGPDEGVPELPYDFDGRLEVREDGYRFRAVNGTLGSSAVKIDGLLANRPALAETRFRINTSGPAFEELIDEIGDFEVAPGSYVLEGELELERDRFTVRDVELSRDRGNLELDLTLGRPLSNRSGQFELRGRGRDIRKLISRLGAFEFFEAPFSIDVDGSWRERRWSFDGFEGSVGDATMQSTGVLELGDGLESTRFTFSGSVPNVAGLGTIDGRRLRVQAISWSGDVTGSEEALSIDNLIVRLGDSEVRGRFRLLPGDVPELDVGVFADSVVVAPLLEADEEATDPVPVREDGRLIPDIAVPFDALKRLDATVDVDIGTLVRDALELRNIGVLAKLEDGVLEVREVGFDAKSGRLDARARLSPRDGGARAELDIVAREFALGISEMNRDLALTSDLDVKLEATGNDLRSMLGTANGVVFLSTRGGRISKNSFLHAVYGNTIEEIIGAINPFYAEEAHINLECVVMPFEIVDGMLTSAPHSFAQTDKIRIAAKSSVNLKDEQLDISLRTTPRRSLSLSAGELVNPYLKIEGTLARPRLAVDETGVLVTGGAAVATGGLTILAKTVWDRLGRSSDPCGTADQQARELLGDRFPDW